MDIGQVHRFQSWSFILVLSHHFIQVLNIVIVLNMSRLCGQNIITNRSHIDLCNGWTLTYAEPLHANTILSKDVLLDDIEHGLAKLRDKLRADLEAMANNTGNVADVRGNFKNRIMDPFVFK